MGSGRIVFIAFVVSALTSAGTFFGLRAVVGKGAPAATVSGRASGGGAAGAAGAASGAAGQGGSSKAGASGASGAKGSRTVNVPRLRAKKLSEAMKVLIDSGLTVGKITRREDKTLAKDLVLTTAPPAGTPLLGGGKVDLFVSNGTTQVAVPRVVGMRLAGAKAKLEGLGFKVRTRYKYDEDKMEGVILGQSPKADEPQQPGATITIVVNRE